MCRLIDVSKIHEIITGPLKGIKGDIIDYNLQTGVIELAIGSEISVMVHAMALRQAS